MLNGAELNDIKSNKTIPIAFIAVLANYTAIQRIHFCYKYLNNTEGSDSSN